VVLAFPAVKSCLDNSFQMRFDTSAGMEVYIHTQFMSCICDPFIVRTHDFSEHLSREERTSLGSHIIMESDNVYSIYPVHNSDQLDQPISKAGIKSFQSLRLFNKVTENFRIPPIWKGSFWIPKIFCRKKRSSQIFIPNVCHSGSE